MSLIDARLDARPVAAARIVIGLVCLVRAFEAARVMSLVLAPSSAPMPLFDWSPRLTPDQLPAFILLWEVAALAFAAGLRTRVAGGVLAAVMGSSLLLDQQLYFSHLYLLTLVVVLLTLADCGARYSVDARTRGARRSVPAWPVTLLKLQLSIVYFFAGVTKINSQYLSGSVIEHVFKREGVGALPELLRSPRILAALALSSVLLEIALAFAFWSRRARVPAVLAGACFHLMMVATITPGVSVQLAIFAVVMLSLYPLFFAGPAPAPSGEFSPAPLLENLDSRM